MRDQLRCHGRPGSIAWNKTGPTGRTRDRKRINHEEAYSMDDACTHWAEEFFCVCAARRLASITTLPVRTFCGMLKRDLGEGTTAVCRTVSKSTASQLCLCSMASQLTLMAI